MISSLRDTRASRSVSPERGREKTTLDTFGRLLQQSCGQLNLFGASSRTYPDTCPLDSPQFIAAYETWVMQLRQDCLQRQSAARPTSGSDCSSLQGERGVADSLRAAVTWTTPNVPNRGCESQESKDARPDSGGIDLQSAETLWLTPQDSEYKGQCQRGLFSPSDRLTNMVTLTDGRPAPDSRSMTGKNPAPFSTPRTEERGQHNIWDNSQALIRQVQWLTPEAQNQEGYQVVNGKRILRLGSQVKQWATPNAMDGGSISRGGERKDELLLGGQVKGKLNPRWVAQLMGLDRNWLAVDPKNDSTRVDELRLAGNGVVPAQAEKAFRWLWKSL